MKNYSDILSKAPKYAQIAQEIKADIAEGRLAAGEQLPTVAEMTERFGVAKHTLERAYAIVEQAGLIRREQGRGIFVDSPEGRKESGLIGFLDLYQTYTAHSPYFMLIQNGVRQVANRLGKHLVIIESPSSFAHWESLDGILLCEMGDYSRAELKRLFPSHLPVINLFFNDPHFPSVQADDAAGVRYLIDHLVQQGHQRIAYIAQNEGQILPVRHRAYREGLIRNGIEPMDQWAFAPDVVGSEGYSRYGYRAMKLWLEEDWRESGCTAILAQNDLTAYGIITALQEQGIRVPEDVSVAGFDGVPNVLSDGVNDSFWLPLQLTTIQVPVFDVATTAMELLVGETGPVPALKRPLVLPVTLREGQSTAARVETGAAVLSV